MKKHFKKLLVATAIGLTVSPTFACELNDVTTETLRGIVNRQGGYPVSDAQCAILNSHHLALKVSGQAAVLGGVNIGWALVTLQNGDRVASTKSGTSTHINRVDVGSQDTANKQFHIALQDAIDALDWKGAANEFSSSGKSIVH